MTKLIKLGLLACLFVGLVGCTPKKETNLTNLTPEQAEEILFQSKNYTLVDEEKAIANITAFRERRNMNGARCDELANYEAFSIQDLDLITIAAETLGATAMAKSLGLVERTMPDQNGNDSTYIDYDTYIYFLVPTSSGNPKFEILKRRGRELFFNELTRCPRFCDVFSHVLPGEVLAPRENNRD